MSALLWKSWFLTTVFNCKMLTPVSQRVTPVSDFQFVVGYKYLCMTEKVFKGNLNDCSFQHFSEQIVLSPLWFRCGIKARGRKRPVPVTFAGSADETEILGRWSEWPVVCRVGGCNYGKIAKFQTFKGVCKGQPHGCIGHCWYLWFFSNSSVHVETIINLVT